MAGIAAGPRRVSNKELLLRFRSATNSPPLLNRINQIFPHFSFGIETQMCQPFLGEQGRLNIPFVKWIRPMYNKQTNRNIFIKRGRNSPPSTLHITADLVRAACWAACGVANRAQPHLGWCVWDQVVYKNKYGAMGHIFPKHSVGYCRFTRFPSRNML